MNACLHYKMDNMITLPSTKQSHLTPGCRTSSTHAAAETDLKIRLITGLFECIILKKKTVSNICELNLFQDFSPSQMRSICCSLTWACWYAACMFSSGTHNQSEASGQTLESDPRWDLLPLPCSLTLPRRGPYLCGAWHQIWDARRSRRFPIATRLLGSYSQTRCARSEGSLV